MRESRRMNSNGVLFEVAQNIRIYLRLNKLGNEKIMIHSVRSVNKLLNGVSFLKVACTAVSLRHIFPV